MPGAIPQILHQTWRDTNLPSPFASWGDAWRKLHPGWDHRFYDDADIRRIVTDRAPHLQRIFEKLTRPIQRADLFRYLIVFLDGGLYADIDMKPYLPSDRLILDSACVLSIEAHLGTRYQARVGYQQPWQIANCIFAAMPNHPFLGELIDEIARRTSTPVKEDDHVEDVTGPRLLTRLLYRLPPERRGSLRVLPQIFWMAPWEYPRIGPLARRIHARHANAGTWRLGTGWNGASLANRWIARNRLPNPFSSAGPVLP